MRYTKLGTTGLDVSVVCFGCMSFGTPEPGRNAWKVPEEQARDLVRAAVESGINFFDTANIYAGGESEQIVGRALREYTKRDEVVIATKVHGTMRPGPNGGGLSRKAIMQELDASLRRLDTDYVDLYQIHRWDPNTPIEETLRALDDVVRAGKVRYVGASSMYAWQFAKALHLAERNGWHRFVTMQNLYNLIYREEEREMVPLCADQGVGMLPWSPLAQGKLARGWDGATLRLDTDIFGTKLFHDMDKPVVEATGRVAARHGIPPARVALAWLMSKPQVTAPIVGVTKPLHVTDAVAAVDIVLTAEDVAELEADYLPHPIYGHR
ncbi:aldo/keto reductase [Phytohabitans flavus]|uniref:Oxidoreductase n=1 Tax=Phytohabitans flavus TaxID=1076124 RepID=A0A6F8XS11_9ACTN|nr:aldo/keto reductase [Phytohabitans flavus]BCB76610.1 oxidoreductase [Phytohabitans flavus]